ncbi:fibroblast growth factor-binding protein 3 [Lissotriton helveticus]
MLGCTWIYITTPQKGSKAMRRSHILPLILLLGCLSTLQRVAAKNEKQASKKGGSPSFARSGQFSTKDNHACAWKIIGDESVSFVVTCTQQQNQSYECAYEGEPQRCPAYSTKAKQYWKHILGKMRKTKSACEDKTLKSRICKKGAATDSQLKLVQQSPSAVEGGKAKGKGRRGELEMAQEPGPRAFSANLDPAPEKKGKAGKQKAAVKSDGSSAMPAPLPTDVTQATPKDEIVELNEDLAQEYCAENLHSLCSFFVNFWNG